MSNEQQKDAEFPDEPENEPENEADVATDEPPALPSPDTPKKGGSGAIAWLALLIAIIGFAAAGYLVFEDWRARAEADRNASALADLRSRLASSDASLTGLDEALGELADSDTRTAATVDALEAELDDRLERLESLPTRMSNVEDLVATFQGISTGNRNRWLLAEAEYYMQIANAQLQLAGNPHLASQALSMADERVEQVADPALIEVRRALSDEQAAIENMAKPDIEGISLTLASLARVVASLPLQQAESDDSGDASSVDESLSGVDRAWASVKGAVSELVRVTPPDETAIPLMTPDAEYFLRTNLALQLQVARLALLRGEHTIFEQSLDDASSWLRTYFDAESAQVRSAEATIDEIRASVPETSIPDISESLRLLRQFNKINESPQ
jgi:uroporphyrin-3 C-methyltransferase